MTSYAEKKQRTLEQFTAINGGEVRLGKDTSNLFRDRSKKTENRLDVRSFNRVLEVNAQERWVEVEGMTPYMDLVDVTLKEGMMPCVVPQLKSITIGGAISGVGIESTSFRYGLVHETILEMDVLTGSGEIITCSPTNEYSDLFYGVPNSYGTLGYILKIKAKTIPVKPFVQLQHIPYQDIDSYFNAITPLLEDPELDFLDGTAFKPGEFFLTVGRMVDQAPYTSDYTYENMYFQSIRTRREDYLSIHDYLWRWDTDWFWCSKNVGAQNPLLRRLFGRKRLNSIFYTRIMRWNAKWGFTRAWNSLTKTHTESVIQDIDIPLNNCREYYEFFDREIGIQPVWICPIVSYEKQARYPLYPINPETTYVNFGHWDVVRTKQVKPPGYFNRLVEEKTNALGGTKSLYSDSYFSEQEFWQIYNQAAYRSLKEKYDPKQQLRDLYNKCVLRQ